MLCEKQACSINENNILQIHFTLEEKCLNAILWVVRTAVLDFWGVQFKEYEELTWSTYTSFWSNEGESHHFVWEDCYIVSWEAEGEE